MVADPVTVFAPAKVNLTLHVTGQRDDGYHLLDSLVVFADVGDHVTVRPADKDSFKVIGPFAGDVPRGDDNLILRAKTMFAPDQTCAILLEKNLPAAAGIGGGSSDAAATLRALAACFKRDRAVAEKAISLGADLPACLLARPCRMSGIGEVVQEVYSLPELSLLLINPGVSVSTPAVFAALQEKHAAKMKLPEGWDSSADLVSWLSAQRNDLEHPAIELAPEIDVTLHSLRAHGALLSRMSGSGATCFGLFDSIETARCAAQDIAKSHPGWWVKSAGLWQAG